VTTGDAAAVEMPLIHRIFRRQFPEVARIVSEVAPTDTGRVSAVAGHLEFLLDGLHAHHTTEDELLWPKLVERVGMDAPHVQRMEQQHHDIDAAVARVRTACASWRAGPSTETAARLVDEIATFLTALEAHLDEEERDVVPLIDIHITDVEWQQVGRSGFEKFTPAQRWIATGQMVEVARPEEAAMMFAKLPPPVRVLWHLVGKRTYRRHITPVRGGAR